MDLSEPHRKLLLVEQFIGAGIVNVILNGAIAWGLMRSLDHVPLWGDPSMGNDILATGFLLPFFTCLIVSRLIRNQVKNGKLAPLDPDQIGSRGMHHRSRLTRSVLLGICGVIFAAAPMVAILHLADAQPVAFLPFVGFKAVWAGLFAMIVSPPIAWWALAAASIELKPEGLTPV